jgi:tRNA pseudouridine55 synthase
LTLDQVRTASARFHGEIEQLPPPFSAKKVSGTPAYKLARAGKPVHLNAARIRISSLEIVGLEGAEAAFTMSVSAGGYVRAVAHELGKDLGCGAHLNSLRRIQAGVFTLGDAHSLSALEPLSGNLEALAMQCLHPRSLLPEMPSVTGDPFILGRLRNGAQANLPEFSKAPMVKVFADQRELVGIARRVAGTLFQPVVVMG